jgi:hypothetical protein
MITTTFKKGKSMRTTSIVFVSPEFAQQFITEADTLNLRAVRETTQEERQAWYQEQVKAGANMMDSAGEPVLAPHNRWTDLRGKLIAVDKVRCKVPFVNGNFKPFTGYGSILVYTEGSSWQQYYLPSDYVRVLKDLIKRHEHRNYQGKNYGDYVF